jgi:hypothetical protein
LDLHGGGRPEMSENTVLGVANRLLAFPRKSLRVLSQEIGLWSNTCQRAAKKTGLHAYRFRVVQELTQQDYDKHMTYCRWVQTFIDGNPGILDYTWFSDEAWFHLSGYVNSQTTHLWGSENSHELFEEPLHSQKVGVFCALSQRRIIGPMFFDTTITSQVYIEHTGGHFQHLLWQPHFIQVWHANVNQHFPGLPSSDTHCTLYTQSSISTATYYLF